MKEVGDGYADRRQGRGFFLAEAPLSSFRTKTSRALSRQLLVRLVTEIALKLIRADLEKRSAGHARAALAKPSSAWTAARIALLLKSVVGSSHPTVDIILREYHIAMSEYWKSTVSPHLLIDLE